MRLAVAGLGLLGVVGIGSLALWLNLRSLGAALREQTKTEREGFVPVTSNDPEWLGTYRLYSSFSKIELRDGGFYEANLDGPGECFFDRTVQKGAWTRDGSTVVLVPDDRTRPQEFELGLLEGGHVLLSEFCTWRQVR